MQRFAILVAALVLSAGAAAGQNTPQGEQDAAPPPVSAESSTELSDSPALEGFIDKVMTEALESEHIAGGAIAIVKDGAPILVRGYGYADLEAQRPVDPERTLFRVGSIAKLFTGTAVMQLVEQGRLDLDADVNSYLTAFKIPATFPEPITLRHLLTHTAGFDERVIGADPTHVDSDIRPLAESLADLMPARFHPPGQVASYSNWSATLAGYIVERVSGLAFADYVERNILAPLQMERSTFREPLPEPLAADLAIGYLFEADSFMPQDFEYISDMGPAGALSSTASDMVPFMVAHLQRGRFGEARILSDETAAAMHSPQFTGHPRLGGLAISFGHLDADGRHLLQHSGATFSFHAELALLPEEGVGLFATFNGQGDAGGKVLKAFLDRYFPTPELPEITPPDDFDSRSARYLGTYRNNRLALTRLEKVTRFEELTVMAGDDGTLFLGDLLSDPANPEEGVELVEIAPNLFRNPEQGFLVAFSENDRGQVSNLLLGASMPSYHRIAWYDTIHVLAGVTALSFLVFAVAGLRSAWVLFRDRRNPAAEPAMVRRARGIAVGLCAAGAIFAAGFTAMVLTIEDYFHYPPGTEVMLALPVVCAVLTAVAAVLALLAWIGRRGTLVFRTGYTVVVLTSVVFLWTLDRWNMLGWDL